MNDNSIKEIMKIAYADFPEVCHEIEMYISDLENGYCEKYQNELHCEVCSLREKVAELKRTNSELKHENFVLAKYNYDISKEKDNLRRKNIELQRKIDSSFEEGDIYKRLYEQQMELMLHYKELLVEYRRLYG